MFYLQLLAIMTKLAITTILFIYCINSLFSQSTIEFSQINEALQTNDVIIALDTCLSTQIEVQYSSIGLLEVKTTVNCPACKKGILHYLKKSGRYQLKTYQNDQFYATVISPKYNSKEIFINGKSLVEQVKYTIYLPKGTSYQIKHKNASISLASN